MIQFLRIIALVALMTTTACATLPTSGPTKQEVLDGATSPENTVPYEIVPITLEVAASERPETVSTGLIELGNLAAETVPPRVDMVHVGDTLAITIYEVGISLFAPERGVAAGGASDLPAASGQSLRMKVREDGFIDLPYIGSVKAAGSYPEAIASKIKSRLRAYSESPEVELQIADTVANTVYVSGEIARPGRFPLTTARERLLDMVTLAGGPRVAPADAELRFHRGDTVSTVRFDELNSEGLANVVLQPGDRIEIRKARETFTVFGAANSVSEIPFETREVTLAEALARAAGPADSRANPRGVFLFRLEKGTEEENRPRPIVYQINMMEPSAYFLAQMFTMRDNDVLLIANSSSNRTSKFMAMLSQLFAPIFAGVALSNALDSNNNNRTRNTTN